MKRASLFANRMQPRTGVRCEDARIRTWHAPPPDQAVRAPGAEVVG
jgi:hypothetical protein